MLSQSAVEQILDRFPIARLGQLDDSGMAQTLPFVFARAGGAVWSPIDGKPKKRASLDRLEWIKSYPDVCVLVDHYESDWSKLWWLKLYCDGTVLRGNHEDWDRAVDALARKYPQYPDVPMFIAEPTMIRFEIKRWTSWAAAGDDGICAWLDQSSG